MSARLAGAAGAAAVGCAAAVGGQWAAVAGAAVGASVATGVLGAPSVAMAALFGRSAPDVRYAARWRRRPAAIAGGLALAAVVVCVAVAGAAGGWALAAAAGAVGGSYAAALYLERLPAGVAAAVAVVAVVAGAVAYGRGALDGVEALWLLPSALWQLPPAGAAAVAAAVVLWVVAFGPRAGQAAAEALWSAGGNAGRPLAMMTVSAVGGQKVEPADAEALFGASAVGRAVADPGGLFFGYRVDACGVAAVVIGEEAAVAELSDAIENVYSARCRVEIGPFDEQTAGGVGAAARVAGDSDGLCAPVRSSGSADVAVAHAERAVDNGEASVVYVGFAARTPSAYEQKRLKAKSRKAAAAETGKVSWWAQLLVMTMPMVRDWIGVRGGLRPRAAGGARERAQRLGEVVAARAAVIEARAALTGASEEVGAKVVDSYADTWGIFASPRSSARAAHFAPVGRAAPAACAAGAAVGRMWTIPDCRSALRLGGAANVTLTPPEAVAEGQRVFIGNSNHHRYRGHPIHLDASDLVRHGRITGNTGMGKSSVQLRIAESVVGTGGPEKFGLLLADPKGGELAGKLLSMVPDERADDLIIVDAGDLDHECPRMNLCHPYLGGFEADEQARAVVAAAERIWSSGFGDRMRPEFVRSVTTLIAANIELYEATGQTRYTILDITPTRFLRPVGQDGTPAFRAEVLSHLRHNPRWSELVEAWDAIDADKSAREQSDMWGPVTNKIDNLNSRPIARLIGRPGCDLDFLDILQEGKIVVFNLSQNVFLGGAHSILASLVFSLVVRSAQVRHDRFVRAGEAGSLRPCLLCLDEAQNFDSTEVNKVLEEGRSMGLALWASHQFMGQLPSDLAEAYANANTHIHFASTPSDCRAVSSFLGDPFSTEALSAMGKYNYVLYNSSTGQKTTAMTVEMPATDSERAQKMRRQCAARLGDAGPTAPVEEDAPAPRRRRAAPVEEAARTAAGGSGLFSRRLATRWAPGSPAPPAGPEAVGRRERGLPDGGELPAGTRSAPPAESEVTGDNEDSPIKAVRFRDE